MIPIIIVNTIEKKDRRVGPPAHVGELGGYHPIIYGLDKNSLNLLTIE
jgi:hypothetical protein